MQGVYSPSMTVWQFAELSDSWSSRVSLLFRNGMCSSDEPPLASLEMTWKKESCQGSRESVPLSGSGSNQGVGCSAHGAGFEGHTSPRVPRLLLMHPASLTISASAMHVFERRSLPARSTRCSLPAARTTGGDLPFSLPCSGGAVIVT